MEKLENPSCSQTLQQQLSYWLHFLATDFFPGCILLDKFPDAIPFHPVEEYEPVVSVLSGHLQ